MDANATSSSANSYNILLSSQQLLEHNEDILAAIVENMQLGRLEDCISHYSVLHRNLINMLSALDNCPTNLSHPYSAMGKFPDELMQKDILEDLLPVDEESRSRLRPLPPPCVTCAANKLSSTVCRVERRHLEPSCKFTALERREYIAVASLLEQRERLRRRQQSAKPKKHYRRWTDEEKYTVLLGIARFGSKGSALHCITSMLSDRTANQVRSYIGKHLDAELVASAERGVLPAAPMGYNVPASAAVVLAAGPNASADTPVAAAQDVPSSAAASAPAANSRFASLLSIAEGQILVAPRPATTDAPSDSTVTIPSLSQLRELAPWTSVPPPAPLSLPTSTVTARADVNDGVASTKKRSSASTNSNKKKKSTNSNRNVAVSSAEDSSSNLLFATDGVYDWGNSMWGSPQQSLYTMSTSPNAGSIFGVGSSPFTSEALSDISRLGKDSLLSSLQSRNNSSSMHEYPTFHVPDEFSMM